MKTNIDVEKEIVIDVSNGVGVMSRISTILAEARINIKAICGYEVDAKAHVRLVADESGRAIDVLTKAGYDAAEHDVVRCEVSPHLIHKNARQLLDGVDVENNYWCAATHSGEHAVMYFSLRENMNAARSSIT